HLDRTVDACLAVRAKIDSLPSLNDNVQYTPKVSIGIHSGEMVSGNIGSAALRRLDYTVIGDIVNTAQRLQSVAEPGQIIIEETSYDKIRESFKCTRVGEVNLKNKANPVTIYDVRD
ncbi:MAG TPA: adenylate/guanylate cyclase domain-containing protein, partial [Chryseolinea sp.]|nr:adenylate/guanylate cyclase domain-containing protein [Chryseolinea sp.]